MSAEKINDLEKRVSGVESTINPLLSSIKELTESNIHLTSEIKHLVKNVEKTSDAHEKLEKRVSDNEKDIVALMTKTRWQDGAGKAVIGTIVAAIFGAIVYSIKGG